MSEQLTNPKTRRRKPRGGQKNFDMLLTDYLHNETFDESQFDGDVRQERDLERIHRQRKRNKRRYRSEDDFLL